MVDFIMRNLPLALIAFLFAVMVMTPSFAQADLCSRIVTHKARTDVHYKPAADILSPDLNAVRQPVLGVISIPIQVDVIERYGLDGFNGLEMKPVAASLEIHPDGKVLYNGQDISRQIERVCESEPENQKIVIEAAQVTENAKAAEVVETPKQIAEQVPLNILRTNEAGDVDNRDDVIEGGAN